MKIDVSVSVEKSGMDFLQHLAALVVAVKAAHVSGANLAVAIPSDIAALIAQIPAMMADAQAAPADLAEDKVAFIKGLMIASEDMYKAIKG